MRRAHRLAERLCGEIDERLGRGGLALDPRGVLDRGDALTLAPPGQWSANRHCRMVRAADGWVAVNLARPDDRDLVAAWLGAPFNGDPWRLIAVRAPSVSVVELRARARLLGLPVALIGETPPRLPALRAIAPTSAARARRLMRVVDLSSLWAGPLCASILGATGAEVTKIESRTRPDTTRASAPALDARLNGGKHRVTLDFADARDRARLRALVADADIVVTSARARAFAPLGLAPADVFAANPRLVWVAISGYGWDVDRVAFGDDAAAAGGLVRWTASGRPRFVGDAIADPLTGLAAASAALEAHGRGGGVLVDAAMAPVAAHAASV